MDIDSNPIQTQAMVTNVVYSTTVHRNAIFRNYKDLLTALDAFNKEFHHHAKRISRVPFPRLRENKETRKTMRYSSLVFRCTKATYRLNKPRELDKIPIRGVIRQRCKLCPRGCYATISVKYMPDINALKITRIKSKSKRPIDKPCNDIKNRDRCQCVAEIASAKMIKKMDRMTL
uniref:Transposase n=1 Tax=Panagrellus redivivus TaxID=6233 RepID=A0A7E4VVC4_PANRE